MQVLDYGQPSNYCACGIDRQVMELSKEQERTKQVEAKAKEAEYQAAAQQAAAVSPCCFGAHMPVYLRTQSARELLCSIHALQILSFWQCPSGMLGNCACRNGKK
jgi:hypothetical protein